MSQTAKARMTPARRAWLVQLRDFGPAKRPPRSVVGFDCMTLGWTEWSVIDRATGERIPISEGVRRYPGEPWHVVLHLDNLERITETGLRALKETESDDSEDE